MFVGPFFYLDSPRLGQKGLLADPCPAGGIKASGRKRRSPVSHEDLLARVAPGEDPRDHPRGEVIYDLDSHMAIIYIDRCIEKHLDQIIRLSTCRPGSSNMMNVMSVRAATIWPAGSEMSQIVQIYSF
jgi:hypothetical protein